jgi:hypothetical protein
MYVNEKMIPVETVPGMGRGGMKESSGQGDSSMIYLIHCKNFHKSHNVHQPSTTIQGKKACFKYFQVDDRL